MNRPLLLLWIIAAALGCARQSQDLPLNAFPIAIDTVQEKPAIDSFSFSIPIPRNIKIGEYFAFMDSLASHYDSLLPYPLTEHALVRANPWIIDSLEATDYYRLMEKGVFVFDQMQLIILKKGDSLRTPSPAYAAIMAEQFRSTRIDVNIPEYKLRIVEGADTLYTFPVRVGQNRKRYLKMAGRVVDLRTTPGTGSIVRINRYPVYMNPCDCHVYQVTHRDNGKVTVCPQIPWLEPELSGRRTGCMIHPTTNPVTLGKAYSNGCVGTREADAWRIYYHAPLGTKVVFRYDLKIPLPDGDTIRLKDVYGWRKKENEN